MAWSTAEELSEQKQEVAYDWAGNEIKEESNETITVYRGDANAEYIEPYDVTIDPTSDLVYQNLKKLWFSKLG